MCASCDFVFRHKNMRMSSSASFRQKKLRSSAVDMESYERDERNYLRAAGLGDEDYDRLSPPVMGVGQTQVDRIVCGDCLLATFKLTLTMRYLSLYFARAC